MKWSSQSFQYKSQADRFAAEKRLEEPRVDELSLDTVQLGRFLREWPKTRRGDDYRAGTRKLDENTIGRLTAYFGVKTRISEITPMQAEQFIATLSRIDGRKATA